MRMEKTMHKANMELVESLHQFITIWKLIGKPFPQVDLTDRPGLAAGASSSNAGSIRSTLSVAGMTFPSCDDEFGRSSADINISF
jgi:hypothetical protein